MMNNTTILRSTVLLILMVFVAQVGFAEERDSNNNLVYDFTKYETNFSFTEGATVTNSLGETMTILRDKIFSATGTRFAVTDNITEGNRWYVYHPHGNESKDGGLYSYFGGYRRLSIMGLRAGQTVQIFFRNIDESNTINIRSNNVSGKTGVKDNQSGSTITSNDVLTMSADGSLDLWVGRFIAITKVIIDDGGIYFNTSGSAGVASYNGNTLPLFRCQLSSRNFSEPTLTLPEGKTATYSITDVESPSGYSPAILRKDNNNVPLHDIMMNNLGVSMITATYNDGSKDWTASYYLEIYDDVATTAITDITNGKKFTITGAGVLHNRTISSVPGVEVGFSVAESGETHNTAVAYNYDDHIVAFTNDDSGWWDRFPHNNSSTPTQGTFYSFKATAKGKLRFGGVKIPNNTAANDGKVYLVKIIPDTWPQARLFDASQTGYLSTNDMVSKYGDNNQYGIDYDTNHYTITLDTTTPDNNGIILETGHTYYLQGEANDGGNKWAPFLLEWFSYELDTELQVNKNFAVADKTGYTIGDNGTYTASDITVTGDNATVGEIKCKGNISSATVTIVNSHLQFSNIDFNTSGENNMGGAIRVKLYTSESNYIYVTLTIPYGKHVWDFRSTAEQAGATRPGAWSYSNEDLCSMMKANGTDWKLVWKVTRNEGTTTTELTDPIMAAKSSIEGNNAFYMDNTAGLIFQAGPTCFGAFDTRNSSGVSIDTKKSWTYSETTATNLLWMKGEATIYFPGVTANQYIKIYTYRHADGKGETYRAKNLVDLDNVAYDGTTRFIMRGMWEQRSPGYVGDNIKGCAIFRVPSNYSATTDLSNIPQLTLCDDGWVKIYRIEIMDEFEPDLIMTDDNNGTFCPVDYDGLFSSVVVRKKANNITPTTRTYTATTGQTRCQHANTCDYEVIDYTNAVTVQRQIWNSGGEANNGVNYNRLSLTFNKAGQIRIIQRERANTAGTGASVEDPANTDVSAALGYVIDKNEYYINAGELTVQDYPYTWDFTNHNMYQGSSNTKTILGTEGSNWNANSNTFSQIATKTRKFGADEIGETQQNLNVTYSCYAQGAQLANIAGTAVAETEGLGISRPTTTKTMKYFASDANKVFHEYSREYEGYDLTSSAITIDGSTLTGVSKITIPEVDNRMYIFVKAGSEPTVKAGETTLTKLTGSDDIFSVADNVYLYKQTASGNQDVEVAFTNGASVELVAVTDIVKSINALGYATESRGQAIDHTYQEKFTNHPVKAYAITTYNGAAYDYKGYPEVRKSAAVSVVPANTGIVLYQANASERFDSPMFYPAVNVEPTEADNTILATNWMAPNVEQKQHYFESICKLYAMSGKSGNHDAATDHPGEDCVWCTKFIMTHIYYTYDKTTGQLSSAKDSGTEGFFRMKIDSSNASHNIIKANKAYLLVKDVPTALWNGGTGTGYAPNGTIFMDLDDAENVDDEATMIGKILRDSDNEVQGKDVYYSLSGVRIIGTPTTKGIYIKNGKKVSIK